METRVCLRCKDDKDVEEFNFRSRKKGTRSGYCRLCSRERFRERYQKFPKVWIERAKRRNITIRLENRNKLIEYLSQHSCIDCGESDLIVLDFDHVKGKKKGNVTRLAWTHSWEAVVSEIEKCVIRCANCHRRKTAKENKFLRYMVGLV